MVEAGTSFLLTDTDSIIKPIPFSSSIFLLLLVVVSIYI